MKKSSIIFCLLATFITALFSMTANAQQSSSQNGVINWLNNGDFNAFLYGEIDSITYSRVDLDGFTHTNPVVQIIWTPDSVYRIPINTIDSVAFKAPETIEKEGIFHITEWHYNYVTGSTESSVTFDVSIPADSLPANGQVVVSDLAFVPYFEKGFAGRVVRRDYLDGKVCIVCEDISFEDVYLQLFRFGKSVSYNGGGSATKAPKKITIDEENVLPFDLDDYWPLEPIKIIDDESGHVHLNVHPSVSLDYAICYNVDKKENRFKCVLKPKLDCDFDVNWHKHLENDKLKIKVPFVEIPIPTKIPLLFIEFNVNSFFELTGDVNINARFPFKLQSNIGYDSQVQDNDGFIFNFNGTGFQTPEGSVDLSATIYSGLSLELEAFFLDDDLDWADASIELKAGPQVTGTIMFESDTNYGLDCYNNFKNSTITLDPLVVDLSTRVNTIFFSEPLTWSPPHSPWHVFSAKNYYLFPDFSAPHLSALGSGSSTTALTTDISGDLIFPVYPGIDLYQNGSIVDSKYSSEPYQLESDWKEKYLQLELLSKPAGSTYTAKPVFKIFGYKVNADPTSTVHIPNPLSLPNSVDIQVGETRTIQLVGGWGDYILTNTARGVCSASITGQTLELKGLKNGTAIVSLQDQRTNNVVSTTVMVGDEPILTVKPTSLNFQKVDKGTTNTKTFTVTGVNLTDNLTLTVNGNYFNVNPTTITPNDDGKVDEEVTVTFIPESVGTKTGSVTVSGGGAENKNVLLSGICTALTGPSYPVDCGEVEVGQIGTTTIRLNGYNTTEKPYLVSLSENHSGEFSVETITVSGSGWIVTVKYQPSGSHSSSAEMTFKSGVSTCKVSLTGTGKGVISVSPATLTFGTIIVNNPVEKTFYVSGTDLTSSLTVSSDNPYFTLSKTSISRFEASEGAEVTVTYNRPTAGNDTGTITVSGGGADSKTVSVSGQCVQPSITIYPASYDFKSVEKGTSATETFTVKGTDLAAGVTLEKSSGSSYFSIDPTSLSKADATKGAIVTVTYNPTATGSHSATFTAKSDGAIDKTHNVKGKGATLTVDQQNKQLGNVYLGDPKTVTFKLTGVNLTDQIELDEFKETNGGEFTYQTSQSQSGNTVTFTVTVTYKPIYTGSSSASFIFKSGNLIVAFGVSGNGVKRPSITVDTNYLDFGHVIKGVQDTLYIRVTGKNLTNDLSLFINQNTGDDIGYYTVKPSTITPTNGAVNQSVAVICSVLNPGSFSGTLNISSDGATTKRVTITAIGVVPSITVTPPWKDFGKVAKNNYSDYVSFKVTGTDLPSSMNVQLIGNNPKMFELKQSTVSAGGSFSVRYHPTALGNHTALVNINGPGVNKNVTVEGQCPTPSISVRPTTLYELSPGVSNIITVTGNYLTDIVNITWKDGSDSQHFTVKPTTISPVNGSVNNDVTVTYNPKNNAKRATGTLIISSQGANTIEVPVSGVTSTPPQD